MSRIADLLAKLCPDGVPFQELGGLGEFIRGRRFTKKDYVDAGLGAIHYGEIYTDYGTSTAVTRSFVRPELKGSLRFAKPGDLVIAATGENVEDVCKAVAWVGDDEIAIHDDCYVFRHGLEPKYVSYFFQSSGFQDQKTKFVSESKVVRISGANLARIKMPVPPREIQREIVAVLDEFAELEATLETELDARRLQYAHYRDSLLAFREAEEVRWIRMGELGTIFGGLTGKSKADFTDGNSRFISYVNVFNNIAVDTRADNFVRVAAGEKQRELRRGDILFTGSSETPDEVGMSSVVTRDVLEPLYLNSFCIGFRMNDPKVLDPDFAKHLFRSREMRNQITRTASGVTRFNVSKARLAQVEVPVPALSEQRRIAHILDTLDTLTNDLSVGLPAEIRARRKQYEHYRDRLLAFPESA